MMHPGFMPHSRMLFAQAQAFHHLQLVQFPPYLYSCSRLTLAAEACTAHVACFTHGLPQQET